MPGVSSALADRLTGGRFMDVQINRAVAARYGMNVANVRRPAMPQGASSPRGRPMRRQTRRLSVGKAPRCPIIQFRATSSVFCRSLRIVWNHDDETAHYANP